MTTWHHGFDEGVWFAIFAARHDEILIDKIVVLDMTDGNELNRINNCWPTSRGKDRKRQITSVWQKLADNT